MMIVCLIDGISESQDLSPEVRIILFGISIPCSSFATFGPFPLKLRRTIRVLRTGYALGLRCLIWCLIR